MRDLHLIADDLDLLEHDVGYVICCEAAAYLRAHAAFDEWLAGREPVLNRGHEISQ